MIRFSLAALVTLLPLNAFAEELLSVAPVNVSDLKAVFATVESVKTVPARARIAGTVATLNVTEGDLVTPGQVIASVGDEKLVAELAALRAQADKAKADLVRAQELARRGVIPRSQLDAAEAANDVAQSQLRAKQQLLAEGDVRAPSEGRVLSVTVTTGTVVVAGDTIATIAADDYLLRLRLPERHARYLKAGDVVSLSDDKGGPAQSGTIKIVYPEIQEGRIVADAVVGGLGEYFVGERVRVFVSSSPREGYFLPERFIATRFGVDYVTLRRAEGKSLDVPVQLGRKDPRRGEIEILSGIKAGDVVVAP